LSGAEDGKYRNIVAGQVLNDTMPASDTLSCDDTPRRCMTCPKLPIPSPDIPKVFDGLCRKGVPTGQEYILLTRVGVPAVRR
jgi:hypothetical protein